MFIVQRKISLLFQNFEVKIHLKPFSSKSDFHNKKRYFAKQNKVGIANKSTRLKFIDRMVISQRRDSMNYLQKLEMIIYWEKATLKANNHYYP